MLPISTVKQEVMLDYLVKFNSVDYMDLTTTTVLVGGGVSVGCEEDGGASDGER